MMDTKISQALESLEPTLVELLNRWVAVPSVKAEAAPGAPFGTEVRRMLDTAMADIRALGFPVKDYDGYACDAEMGQGEETIAVLGHLDVVPAGDGWQTPPFTPVREGDRIYGRGTSDDKGPVIAALVAMKALALAGVPLKKKIRLILGCDEESGWEDMAYYAAHARMPEVGFSPDASFPVINTEKGMIQFHLKARAAATGMQVKRWVTGERMNVIPGVAQALLEGDEALAERVRAYAAKTGLPYTAEVTPEGVLVTAEGIPGHSAYPQGRRNAIGMILCLLTELGAEGPLAAIARAVGMEHDGASLGCACADEVSGALTCNMGIMRVENGDIFCTLDYRCPVAADQEALIAATREHLPGVEVTVVEQKAPHHVPEDSELVRCLLAAYHEETGLPAKAFATGGGTYAKVLKQGVAFGASFPDDEDLAHQAGEYASVSGLMKSAKIFANALLRLAGA